VTSPVAEDKSTLSFEADLAGEITSLSIPLEPLVPTIVFQRMADPEMRTREFLSPLVGAYELGASIWDVVLREDGVLQLRMQTGQVFDLEPVRDHVPDQGAHGLVAGIQEGQQRRGGGSRVSPAGQQQRDKTQTVMDRATRGAEDQ
jgi:hypothetical protein